MSGIRIDMEERQADALVEEIQVILDAYTPDQTYPLALSDFAEQLRSAR